MSKTHIKARRLLTPAGWRADQTVVIESGVITEIAAGYGGEAARVADILAPGLFDTHNHGGEGFDPASRSFEKLGMFLAGQRARGVTDILLTAAAADAENARLTFDFIREAIARQTAGTLPGARIQGIHMEGPFLNPARPGAIAPERMLRPDPAVFERLFGAYLDIIKLVTLAPEVEGGFTLAAWLAGRGIKVQAGHTDADFETASAAFASGVDSLCHTFNAARPIHHRDPGVVAAALVSPNVYCEAICDLEHLHAGTLRLIYQCKGPSRVVVISDSTMPNGLPDGEYGSAEHPVIVRNGIRRTPSGALSGGICYLDGSVRNLVDTVGIPPEHALTMASRTPAERIGLTDLGVVRPGARAHLTAFTDGLLPAFTVIGDTIE